MEIKIGISADLSGPEYEHGHTLVNAVRLAVEEKGSEFGIRLVAGDDRAEGERAMKIAEALCEDEDVVAVVGPMTSDGVDAAGQLYEEANLPFITPSASNPSFSQRDWRYFFRLTGSDVVQTQVLVDVVGELGKERVAVITDRSAFCSALSDLFITRAKDASFEILGNVAVDRERDDYTEGARQLHSLAPEIIFFGLIEREGQMVARSLRELGSLAIFVGTDALKGSRYLETPHLAVDGPYQTNMGVDLDLTPQRQEFRRRYRERFEKPPTVYSAESYDAGALIASALAAAGPNRKGIREYLATMPAYPGLSGPIAFTEQGERKTVEVGVYRLHRGETKLMKRLHV